MVLKKLFSKVADYLRTYQGYLIVISGSTFVNLLLFVYSLFFISLSFPLHFPNDSFVLASFSLVRWDTLSASLTSVTVLRIHRSRVLETAKGVVEYGLEGNFTCIYPACAMTGSDDWYIDCYLCVV